MISILIFKLYKGQEPDQYPSLVHTLGGCLSTFGLMQLPIFMCYAIAKAKGDTLLSVSFFNFFIMFLQMTSIFCFIYQKIKRAFTPVNSWGPQLPEWYDRYVIHMQDFKRSNPLLDSIQSCVSTEKPPRTNNYYLNE